MNELSSRHSSSQPADNSAKAANGDRFYDILGNQMNNLGGFDGAYRL
jgi:hypothetical protein